MFTKVKNLEDARKENERLVLQHTIDGLEKRIHDLEMSVIELMSFKDQQRNK